MKKLVLDIETENTGADIMADNKRIISVQLGNSAKQELYFADSKDTSRSLSTVKSRISSLLSEGIVFAGYNVKGFDVPMLKEFLDIDIPNENLLELYETEKVATLCRLKNRRTLRLEEVCKGFDIDTSHKDEMNHEAEKYKMRPDIVKKAQTAAKEIVDRKGWSFDFSYNYTLDKLAGGNAIYDSYLKFVERDGSPDTLFHRYAVGDIISEYRLLQAVTS
ncbi:MAG: hypothetical protein NTV61_04090 [Candidatus Bathyarchaeota archaeon]|nr:hypothetical protein [Candidatus Bathyarchaeota archaeon]